MKTFTCRGRVGGGVAVGWGSYDDCCRGQNCREGALPHWVWVHALQFSQGFPWGIKHNL